jgi:hypothetical protein
MNGRLSRQDAAAYASNPSVFETPAASAGAAAPGSGAAPGTRPPMRPAMEPAEPAKKPGLFGR